MGEGLKPPVPPWLRYWMEHFFSPNSGGDFRSDAHQSQIIGGDADVDHTQIIGGIQSKYWRDISPPSPPGFDTPAHHTLKLKWSPSSSNYV